MGCIRRPPLVRAVVEDDPIVESEWPAEATFCPPRNSRVLLCGRLP